MLDRKKTPSPLLIDAWAFELNRLDRPALAVDIAGAAAVIDPLKRSRRALSRTLLRRVLSLRLARKAEEIIFEIAPGGKPHVKGCEFSLSHSGAWLLVAVADAPVGVDIETQSPRRSPLELAARFFSPPDVAKLRTAAETARSGLFLQQWVAKEAALKAAGVGLSQHLHRSECLFDQDSIHFVRWGSGPREGFAIREFTLRDGTPGAVAFEDGDAEIRWRDPAEVDIS